MPPPRWMHASRAHLAARFVLQCRLEGIGFVQRWRWAQTPLAARAAFSPFSCELKTMARPPRFGGRVSPTS